MYFNDYFYFQALEVVQLQVTENFNLINESFK